MQTTAARVSRYSATRRFRDLKVGDLAYSIHTRGNKVYALIQKVVGVHGDMFSTLSCYSDGSPLIYFRAHFSRRSGVERYDSNYEPITDRPKTRLYLDLPEGMFVLSAPQRQAA